MSRYLNLESLVVLLLCLAVGVGGCLLAGLGLPKAIALGLVFTVLAFFPVSMAVQDKLVEVYAERGNFDRALNLAIAARDTAPNSTFRNRALVDLALVHLLRRDYLRALENLEKVKTALIKNEAARAVVEGHLAYCLAHLHKDLERAETLARTAMKGAPEEHVFGYFVGLALLERGLAAEAEPFIAESLEKDPDPAEPFPGERAWALARARLMLGKDAETARAQAVAAGGYYAEQARALTAANAAPVPSPAVDAAASGGTGTGS